MAEEIEENLIDKEEKGRRLKQRLVRSLIVVVVVLLIVMGGLVTILQFTTYDKVQGFKAPEVFIKDVKSSLNYAGDGFQISVPDDVAGYTMNAYIREALGEGNRALETLFYDGLDQRAYMNMTVNGFYLPISSKIVVDQLDQSIKVSFTDFELSRYGWSGPLVNQIVKTFLGFDDLFYTLPLSEYSIPSGLELVAVNQSDDGLIIQFVVDEAAVRSEITKLRQGVDEVSLAYYKSFDEKRTAPVLKIVESLYPLSDEQIHELVNDAIGDKYILNDLLMLAEGYDMTQLDILFQTYGILINQEQIEFERKAFKGQAVDAEISEIFVALDEHFKEKIMAFNGGKPFDIELMQTLTVPTLVELYDLDISEDLVGRLTFVYEDAFKVAYRLDQESYYIRGIDDFRVVTTEDYKDLLGSDIYVHPTYVKDRALWDQITAFLTEYLQSEGVYVRYMKSDGKSTFAVVSTFEDPQDYWSTALISDESGVLTLLEENVKSVAQLLAEHPEFNIETATKEVETASFERIADDTHRTIIDELYSRRMIDSTQNIDITYSAYDGGTYIAFMLSNGKEYVFKVENTVYGTYLATVYDKEKALRNWRDMPEILLLQNIDAAE